METTHPQPPNLEKEVPITHRTVRFHYARFGDVEVMVNGELLESLLAGDGEDAS